MGDAAAERSRNEELLYLSARSGHIAGVDALLNRGADVTRVRERNVVDHALMVAVLNGHTRVMQRLFDRGVPVDTGSSMDGDQSIHRAAEKGYLHVINFLAEKKADLEVISKRNQSPLHVA